MKGGVEEAVSLMNVKGLALHAESEKISDKPHFSCRAETKHLQISSLALKPV